MYLPCSLSLLSIPVTVLPRCETAGSQRARLWKCRTGGISGRPRKRGKDAGAPQPSSRNPHRPRAPAPFSDVRRRDSRHASRGAGSGARAWKWAGWESGGGCEVYAAWHLPPLFTRWGASKQVTFLVPRHSGRPGTARWTPFSQSSQRRAMLPPSAAPDPGRARRCGWFPPASGLGLGVRRLLPPWLCALAP